MTVSQMLSSHPAEGAHVDLASLTGCVEACFACAQSCTSCADACLAEEMVTDLRACIRADLDCANVCAATGAVLSRQTATDLTIVRSLLEACATACKRCGDECESHADMHEHCRVCAEACRRCEQACRDLLSALG